MIKLRNPILKAGLALGFASSIAFSMAQADTTKLDLAINGQNAGQALLELSQNSGVQIIFTSDVVEQVQLGNLNGQYTLEEALNNLLAGSGLAYNFTADNMVVIKKDASGDQASQLNERTDARKPRVMEEILVTATKKGRAENVQDVPIAITAMGEEQLDAMHFDNITDIGHSLPNTTLDNAAFVGGQATFFIRGIGVNVTSQSMDPAVGVTVNGMALGQNLGMTTDSFDLESLEVLRGPQGTLFGRNATGGVIVLRTKRPTGEFGFEMRGTVGSYDRKDIALAVEDALIDDKVSGRLAVIYKDHDGYYKNFQGGRIGEETSRIIRPTLRFTPTESLEITLMGEYGKSDYGMPPLRNIYNPDTFFSGVYTPPNDDLHDLDQNFVGPNELEWKHAIAEVNWNVGPGQLTSITAYREQKAIVSIDLDGTSSSIATVHFLPSSTNPRQVSQEVRYAFDLNDSVNLTTGLYYFDQSYRPGTGVEAFGTETYKDGFVDHSVYAIFAQGEIGLSDRWNLILGGRYSEETKDVLFSTAAGCPTPPSSDPTSRIGCTYDFERDDSWTNFSPKVGLQWLISDNTQAYASWTRGFKSGGFNNQASSPATAAPFDEETVEAYEVGLKTDLLDNRLRLNLAAFYNDYTDMQRISGFLDTTTNQFVNAVINVGGAVVMGFEAEMKYLVTDRLSLNVTLGLMDNDIQEFEGLDLDGDSTPDPELAKDLELAKVPDLTYGLGVVYDIPLSIGDLSLRGDYAYTDERFGEDKNLSILDPVRRLNLSLTYMTSDGRYSLSAFGKNVLNDSSRLHELKSSFWHVAQINAPATWGVEFKYEF